MNPVGKAGHSSPLGATVVDGGVNFSLFSRSATGVELLFFDREDDARPARVIRLDPVSQPHLPLLARVRAGRAAGAALRLSRGGTVRSRQAACGLTPPKFSSTRMAAASWCRKTTVATPPGRQATMPRRR